MNAHSFPFPLPHPRVTPEHVHLHAARGFLARQGEAVARAARLVAGPHEADRARALAAAIARAPRLDRPLRAELVRLHRLLSLQLDPAHGADLHPADPRVHEVCRLTDALGALLDDLAAPTPATPSVVEVIPLGVPPRARRRAAR